MDAIDTPNFSIDYRDGKDTPKLGFGFDVSDPTRFNYGPALADGTVRGDYSFQVSTSTNTTNWLTAETNLHWKVADALTLKAAANNAAAISRCATSSPTPPTRSPERCPPSPGSPTSRTRSPGAGNLWGDSAPSSLVPLGRDKLIQHVQPGRSALLQHRMRYTVEPRA
jgi:iron complex outermembrane receptor protein